MIINFNFGTTFQTPSEISREWKYEYDDKKALSFLSREDICQKIKLKNLNYLDKVSDACLRDAGMVPSNSHWDNNQKTMSPTLVMHRKNAKFDKKELIIYITLDNSLKLLKYRSNNEIRHSYTTNTLKGCAIICDENNFKSENNRIITVFVKNMETKRFQVISIDYDKKTESVDFSQKDVSNKNVVHELREIDKNSPNGKKFRYYIHESKPITQTLIVKDDATKDSMEKDKKMKYKTIISMQNKSEEDLIQTLKSEWKNNHIRAVTIIGSDITIPYNVWIESKILFVFQFDTETHRNNCIKSI